MSVSKPKSAETITDTTIRDMQDNVSNVVNNIQPTNVGRSSINTAHLGTASLVIASGVAGSGGITRVSNYVSAYNTSVATYGLSYTTVGVQLYSEVSSWQTIATLNLATANYKDKSPMVINFNCRIAEYLNSGNTEIKVDFDSIMIWFGIIIERTDVATSSVNNLVIEESVVGVHLQESRTYINASASAVDRVGGIEQAINHSIMHITDDLYNYNHIRIKAAVCPCDSSFAGATPATYDKKVSVRNQFASYIVYEPGA